MEKKHICALKIFNPVKKEYFETEVAINKRLEGIEGVVKMQNYIKNTSRYVFSIVIKFFQYNL